jgi:hypothetical protein
MVMTMKLLMTIDDDKTKETNKPECSHVKHFCRTYFISTVLYIGDELPYECRLWSVDWGGVQSVECEDSEDSGVLTGKLNVQGMKWKLWCVKCRVWSAKRGL